MEFPLNFLEICIACGIVTIGAALQGSIGFGLGPVAVPLLLLIDPVFVPGPLLLTALVLTLLMYRREKHAVKMFDIKWAVAGRLAGAILGATLLVLTPPDYLSLLFAIMVLLALLIFISGFKLSITAGNLFRIGTLSGFMGTTSSIGGAPMALLYQEKEGPRLRGTLSGVFMIGTVISLVSLIIINKFGWDEFLAALILMPGIIIGYIFSGRTSKILDRGFIRPAILIVSGATSILLIIRYYFQ